MPKKIKARRTAPKTRGRSPRGKNKTKQGCQGPGKPAPAAPRIIADSVFALTLPGLKGIDVEARKERIGGDLLSDLRYIYLQFDVKDTANFPPGMTMAEKVEQYVKKIKSQVPEDCEIILDYGENGLQLDIIQICQYVNFLPAIEIGKTVSKLKKTYPLLHDLFVDFIGMFTWRCSIECWYDGMFQHSLERCEEMYEYDHDGMEPEWVEKLADDIDRYKKGEPHEYELMIRKAKNVKPENILKRLARLKKKNPVIGIIKKGCELITPGCTMNSYFNEKVEEQHYGDVFLRFDCQAVVLWEFSGTINDEYDQWIEMEANEGGLAEPINTHTMTTKKYKPFDLESFKVKTAWPRKLAQYMNESAITLNNYAK